MMAYDVFEILLVDEFAGVDFVQGYFLVYYVVVGVKEGAPPPFP